MQDRLPTDVTSPTLKAIKAAHTIVWAVFAGCILAIPVTSWRGEHGVAGWLAAVLAEVAAIKGSSEALTAGSPGSWEASLVDQLVKGAVGWDDEYLPDPEGASSS